MKAYSIFTVLISLSLFSQPRHKLIGKYKMLPNHGRAYFINICDSFYTKHFDSGETTRGIVEYSENYIYLRDYEKELRIIGSDSLYVESKKFKEMSLISVKFGKGKKIEYSLHVYEKGGPTNWLDVSVSSGKMIRINKKCR